MLSDQRHYPRPNPVRFYSVPLLPCQCGHRILHCSVLLKTLRISGPHCWKSFFIIFGMRSGVPIFKKRSQHSDLNIKTGVTGHFQTTWDSGTLRNRCDNSNSFRLSLHAPRNHFSSVFSSLVEKYSITSIWYLG